MFFLPLLLSLAARALAQCETECNPLTSLLSDCFLPRLPTTESGTDVPPSDYRNITGLEFYTMPYVLPGPHTSFLETATQAECLCIEGVHILPECNNCLSGYRFSNSLPMLQDDKRAMDRYESDCTEWGYFANETLAYPSTTRSAMPSSATGPADPGPADKVSSSCASICGVIRGQIDDCGLTPLDIDEDDIPWARVDPAYAGSVLLNRTAGECMCSLPVLRRLRGCWMCVDAEKELGVPDLVRYYREECNELGYWTDSAVVEPLREELEESEESGEGEEVIMTDGAKTAMYISTGKLALMQGE
ncbi:hypothetical protein BDV10DRAFT_190258 [Aspergillus recurvatus]